MLRRKFLAGLGAATLGMPGLAKAQSSNSVQLIVPAPGGSRTGYVGRILAAELGTALGRPVTPVNIDTAADAYFYLSQGSVDGSVIGLVAADIATFPHRSSMYATMEKLTPLALLATDPAGIHVQAEAPYTDARALAAAVKSQSGQLKIAGAGAIWHLSTVRWLAANGMKPSDLPWSNAEGGIGAAAAQLAAGQTNVLVCSVPEMRATSAGKKLKTLALMSDRRNGRYPGIPTVGEKGGTPLHAGIWRGLAAPKGINSAATGTITDAVRKAHASPAFQAAITRKGFLPVFADSAGFQSFASAETQAIGEAMRAAGLV